MRVAVTGGAGTVGAALIPQLENSGFDAVSLDLPGCDVRDYAVLEAGIRGCTAVVHLAWNTAIENFRSQTIHPDNALMTANVYRAALTTGVRRVVAASSIHADRARRQPAGPLTTSAEPVPDSRYGASKVFLEALGRHHATRGLEVVCIRLGAVTRADEPPRNRLGRAVWLAHDDCADLVRRALVASTVPSGYCCVYAVSDNRERFVDLANPFGWWPSASSEGRLLQRQAL